jgi:hypothetical protein
MGALVPVVRFLPGVELAAKPVPLQPAGVRILAALDNLSRVLGLDVTVTCGTDSHPPSDVHTAGEAFDVRVKDWTIPVTLKAVTFLKQVLGERFTVLYECPEPPKEPALAAIAYTNPNATGSHLHIQRKRGTVYPPVTEQANAGAPL